MCRDRFWLIDRREARSKSPFTNITTRQAISETRSKKCRRTFTDLRVEIDHHWYLPLAGLSFFDFGAMLSTEGLPPYFVEILRTYFDFVFEPSYMTTDCESRDVDVLEIGVSPSVALSAYVDFQLQ